MSDLWLVGGPDGAALVRGESAARRWLIEHCAGDGAIPGVDCASLAAIVDALSYEGSDTPNVFAQQVELPDGCVDRCYLALRETWAHDSSHGEPPVHLHVDLYADARDAATAAMRPVRALVERCARGEDVFAAEAVYEKGGRLAQKLGELAGVEPTGEYYVKQNLRRATVMAACVAVPPLVGAHTKPARAPRDA